MQMALDLGCLVWFPCVVLADCSNITVGMDIESWQKQDRGRANATWIGMFVFVIVIHEMSSHEGLTFILNLLHVTPYGSMKHV